MEARQQEKHGDLYVLRGDVNIEYENYRLQADQVTYNETTGEATAEGHVVLDGGLHDEHIAASHATYNVNNDSGRFWEVVGTTGVKLHGKSILLTSSTPFFFRGAVVDKIGRDKIVVHHGVVTSCTAPQPKWSFHAERVSVVPGDDAKMYYSAIWIWRLPLLYFPYFDHALERTRKTGLLMPELATSSVKGDVIGDGVFWAINRSMGATLAAELYSLRGWSEYGDFSARPSDSSYLAVHYFQVLDLKGAPTTETIAGPGGSAITVPARQNQGGEEVTVGAGIRLPENIRAVADIDYLSSYLYRESFADSFRQATNSEVRSTGFLTRDSDGYSLNAMAARYQDFQSPIPSDDFISIRHSPSLAADSVARALGNSPFYWDFDSSLDALGRSEPICCYDTNGNLEGSPSFSRATAGRLDLSPELLLPRFWRGWTVAPEVALRDTFYTQSRVLGTAPGEASPSAVNRRALESVVELRPPTLARVFDRPLFGRTFKHYLEPHVIYRDVAGVDNFQNILRFDERDILSDTNELEYGLVQRFFSKRVPAKGCTAEGKPVASPPSSATALPGKKDEAVKKCVPVGPGTEVVTWELAQKYYFDRTFGGALVPGVRNVLESTVDFTGIAFLTEPRNLSPVISRLRWHLPKVDGEWNLDYDSVAGRISYSSESLGYRLTNQLSAGGGATFLHAPGEFLCNSTQSGLCNPSQEVSLGPSQYNQFNVNGHYGQINKKGFAAGASLGFDADSVLKREFNSASIQANYNWDCCGVVVEYRRWVVGTVRDDHELRFAFSLSNVGSFGTLRKVERLY
jgi:LPS-assembly protein